MERHGHTPHTPTYTTQPHTHRFTDRQKPTQTDTQTHTPTHTHTHTHKRVVVSIVGWWVFIVVAHQLEVLLQGRFFGSLVVVRSGLSSIRVLQLFIAEGIYVPVNFVRSLYNPFSCIQVGGCLEFIADIGVH